ncbi:MAG: Sec-independent protein translocase protein TatB [Acidobacteria bacterium]|nr:Sec-independent protein translocase protein TatB [Acidobacteriota bacterium]
MFNVGGGEIIVILLLALLVLGPEKLPATAKKVGRFLHEVRRMTSGFEQEVRKAMDFENLGTDLGDSTTAAASSDDAVHRATDGPRLSAPTSPIATSAASAGTSAGTPPGTPPPAPGPAPFVADLSAPRHLDDQA